MDLMTLKKQIRNKQLDNLYVFTGEEVRIMEIFLTQMAECCNSEILNCSILSYYNKIGIKGFITKPTIYVIRDEQEFTKQTDKIWDKLVKRNNNDVVVLVYNTLDKRSKFYKHFQPYLVEFMRLSQNVVVNYLKKDCNIPKDIAEYIVKNCKADYNMCLLECDKLLCYQKATDVDINVALNICIHEHILSTLPEENVLQTLMKDIMSANFRQAIITSRMLDIKTDPPLKVLIYLYNNFKALFSVVAYECGLSNKKGESVSNFWAVKNVEIFSPQWNLSQTYSMLKLLQQTEQNIKTGVLSPDRIYDILIGNIAFIHKGYKIGE